MNALQTKISNTPKQRGFRFWISCFVIPIGLGILGYYGYCFGLWGRNSLLLQYLFQCKCPVASKEARYSKEVDVIVPACREAGVKLSPSGRLLYVREGKFSPTSIYLLDLQTNEKVEYTLPDGVFYFLTDNLLYYEYGEYILDRATGKQYPIQKFRYSLPDAEVNRNTNLALLAENLHNAKDVFLITNSQDVVVALNSDFHIYPEHNFVADRFDLLGSETEEMEKFLLENNIAYQTILLGFPSKVLSPDGKLLARDDGIYLVETNQMIVKAPHLFVMGWNNDGSGAIYTSNSRCLLSLGFPLADDTWCEIEVPQPVLLVKVPEEYLSPTQTP